MHFKMEEGTIHSRGKIEQKYFAYSASEVCEEFQKNGDPIWCRESGDEDINLDHWRKFTDLVDQVAIPQYNLSLDLNDVDLWIGARKRMPSDKARGVCRLRVNELQLLPHATVEHLKSNMVSKIIPVGTPLEVLKPDC